jgi:ElaB/YqjD/DUF883 family membrane-anchored ribosome-binding protein
MRSKGDTSNKKYEDLKQGYEKLLKNVRAEEKLSF